MSPSSSSAPASAPAGLTARWEPGGVYSLRDTLSPVVHQAGPAGCFVQGAAWLAFTTATGPLTLRLTELADGAVQAQAWGLGAEAALDSLPALLGAHDTDKGLSAPGVPELPRLAAEGRRRAAGMRLPRTGRMIDALIPAVLEQKVTTVEAKRGYWYLVRRFGQAAPGPAPAQLLLPPTPPQWARIPSWEWHRAGVGPQRSDTVMRAVRLADSLERAAGDPVDIAARKLQSIPGIGAWTSAEILQRTHGCPDSVSVGDYHLAAFVGYALTGAKTDDAGMIELLRPWAGQRQRVVRWLYASGFSKPRFGARMSIQDHRRH